MSGFDNAKVDAALLRGRALPLELPDQPRLRRSLQPVPAQPAPGVRRSLPHPVGGRFDHGIQAPGRPRQAQGRPAPASPARRSTWPTSRMPGMQHVAFVRSPHAHARVRGITERRRREGPGGGRGGDRAGSQGPLRADPGRDRVGRGRRRGRDQARAPALPALAGSRALRGRAGGRGASASRPRSRRTRSSLVEVDWEPLPAVADPFAGDGGRARRSSSTTRRRTSSTPTPSRRAIPTRPSRRRTGSSSSG